MSGRANSIGPIKAKSPLPIAARRNPLVREVDRQLARSGLRNTVDSDFDGSPCKVVVAVSGGSDSVALLLACVNLRGRRKRECARFEAVAVHVHHHLRDSADDDAAFVQALCDRIGVECVIKHVRPRDAKGNLAANARKLRYVALAKAAAECDAKCVLVAHHAEDQLETILMALCRGAGPRGLAGMKLVTRLACVDVVRPLLQVNKAQCEELCRAAGIQWREDPSNRDATKRRARLRRDVLPVLEELWPGAAKRAAKCAMLTREKYPA